MKELQPLVFDPSRCPVQLSSLRDLLATKSELSEADDIQPLFKACHQLVFLLGLGIQGLSRADRFAFEFDVFGNYTADLVIGNIATQTYCAVEFEDARENSVLHKTAGRSQKEWGRRLEHGFGQLIDWFHAFDDHKNTADFAKHFGYGHVKFHGLLLIGRSAHLTDYDRSRFRWRSDRVTVNTHKSECWTYDELYEAINSQWQITSLVSQPRQDYT
jgi:hypothetical protein